MRAVRLVTAAVACAALGAGMAGCGSSSSKSSATTTSSASSTTAWADGLCNALDTWQTSVQASVPKPGSGNLSVDSLKQSATEVADASDKLASDVSDLGKPPTPGAEQAKSAVQTLSNELSSQDKKIKDAVSSISGAADVVPAVSTITAAVTAMGDDLKTATGELKSVASDKQWQNAFADASSCQKLSGS